MDQGREIYLHESRSMASVSPAIISFPPTPPAPTHLSRISSSTFIKAGYPGDFPKCPPAPPMAPHTKRLLSEDLPWVDSPPEPGAAQGEASSRPSASGRRDANAPVCSAPGPSRIARTSPWCPLPPQSTLPNKYRHLTVVLNKVQLLSLGPALGLCRIIYLHPKSQRAS